MTAPEQVYDIELVEAWDELRAPGIKCPRCDTVAQSVIVFICCGTTGIPACNPHIVEALDKTRRRAATGTRQCSTCDTRLTAATVVSRPV